MCEKVPQKETPLCQTIQQGWLGANIFCQLQGEGKKYPINFEYQQVSWAWIISLIADQENFGVNWLTFMI